MRASPSAVQDVPIAENDLALVRRVLVKDPTAIDAFVERMRCVPRMLARKNAQYGHPIEANELEDFGQEVLLAIWRKLEHYSGTGSLEAWAYRFAHLELLYRLRKQDSRPKLVEDLDPSVDKQERDAHAHDAIVRTVDDLGPPDADIIRMRHFDGMAFEGIAKALELSTSATKTRYYRSLKRLRLRLRSYEPGRGDQ